MDNNILLSKLENARSKYKPTEIKVVIVAEAPPESLERFFYFENVKIADFLFLGISEVLYPKEKANYLFNKRNPLIKEQILKQFKSDGYYLLDLFELPITLNKDNNLVAVKKLSDKIENLCDINSPIILVKTNVYDIAYSSLKLKFNVINKRIDFPSCGNQLKFYNKFAEALKQIGSP